MSSSLASLLFTEFSWVDVIDVAVVATVIYAILTWASAGGSRFVMIGVGISLATYALASLMGMRLSTLVLNASMPALILGSVVVFQEDIRRAFEQLGRGFVWKSRRSVPDEQRVADILINTCGRFSARRLGALIVVTRGSPLDRHLFGGWSLDGELSEALLDSIFDSSSLGHDGAVVVRGARVARFGVKLPLSTQLEHSGTRHLAALGLSEMSDALVLVVSEESGEVSCAQDRQLRRLSSAQELKPVLAEALGIAESARWRFGIATLRRNWRLKLLSVVLAALFWLSLPLFGAAGPTHPPIRPLTTSVEAP